MASNVSDSNEAGEVTNDQATLTARSYQTEILNHVAQRNSIICMGTGTGKTFIAVMLIKDKAHEVQKPFDEGGKRTFFLTNAVTLAHQQGEVIRQHTNLKVQTYVGSDGVDQWMTEPGRWENEFRRNQVLVMTAQILLNILQHGLLHFSRINLLVFDECHHAKKNHAYVKIMEHGRQTLKEGDYSPHVLGLTASILDKHVQTTNGLEESIAQLEKKLNSTAITSADPTMELYGTKPEESIIECARYEDKTGFNRQMDAILDKAVYFIRRCESGYKKKKGANSIEGIAEGEIPVGLETVIKDLDDYRVVMNILGPIAADYVAHQCLDKLLKETKSAVVPVEVNRRFFRLGVSIFSELTKEYEDYETNHIEYIEDAEAHCPPKVRKLIKDILYLYRDQDNKLDTETRVPDEDSDEDLVDMIDIGDDDEDDDVDDDEEEDEEDEEEEGKEADAGGSDNESDKSGDEEVEYLNAMEDTEGPTNENLTGIIFVERRITSFALHKLLERFFGWDETLGCLKSGYIVGGGGRGEEVHHTAKRHEATLRAFRKKIINLLVSTSVLQEGIDIPKCNLVVLLDVPKNYREYIQAKGRARASGSKFCVLATVDELEDCAKKIKNYQELEIVIASKCLKREETKEEPIDDADDFLPPYKGPVLESGAQAMLTMSSSVSLINQYCSLLPTDSYARLAPECVYKEYADKDGVLTYQCTIQLPITSPVRDPIVGPIMPKKKLAQMATALKICESLHKCGELNDNLLPAYRGVENSEDVLSEEIRGPGKLDSTGASGSGVPTGRKKTQVIKTKKLYKKAYAEAMSGCLPVAGQPLYLYEISMRMTALAKEHKGPRKVPEDSPRSFGLLLSKELPNIPDFPIYISSGEVTIRPRLVLANLVLDEECVKKALIYHRYIIRKVLSIERENFTSILFNPEEGIQQVVLVPIIGDQIDWEFVDFIISKKDLPYQKFDGKFVWAIDQWKDTVVTRTYREPPAFFFVNEICTDMTPYSKFPNDSYTSFHDYYSQRYELRVKNKKQPLLDVAATSKHMNLLTPRYMTKQGQALPASDKERHLTHFVPELCGIHVFPESMWRKATCLPSILYRLNSLYKASELRERITREGGICITEPPEGHAYPRLDFGFKLQAQLRPINKDGDVVDDDDKKEDEEKMKYLEQLINQGKESSAKGEELADQFVKRREELEVIEGMGVFAEVLNVPDAELGPSACHILQALTLQVADDFFNLERMEVMGDSFLKYVVTVYLYLKYPDIHEGKLTNRRMALTNNTNLHKLGCEKKIDEVMVSMRFAPNDNWLPPCYNVKEMAPIVREGRRGQADEVIAYCVRTQQEMFDKNIADCIEALIGCYLITSGAAAARGFLTWLGLEVKLESTDVPPDPVMKSRPDWEVMLEREVSDLHVFEESIQYEFKNKAFLLEALTHASYAKNRVTECYQRLEFLGDAIIDYTVTRYLFEDCRQHSPGLLTDLRSALVNNNIFAKLAVKYNYHLSFKYLNPELFYVIDRFVKAQKELGDSIQADMDADLDEDIEIPKVLGDLFESVAGAIYLDSGMSLDTVWGVYYRMMKELIIEVTVTLPKSPVRELMELATAGCVNFSRPMRQESGKMKVQVEVIVQGDRRRTFSAISKNHRTARVAAAKKAVKALKEEAGSEFVMGQV